VVVENRDSWMGVTPLLYVIDYFRDPHAGTEGQLCALVEGLDGSEFAPHLLVFEDSPWLREKGFPCEYTVLGHRSLASPATWLALARVARRFRRQGYRLAHVFFNDPSIICPPLFRMFGIHTLLSRRDMGYWYTPAIKRILRTTGRFAEGVIANSKAVKSVTAAEEGFAEEDIHVIYNGYPDSKVRSSVVNPQTTLLENLRKQGGLLMGLVANIRPIKRIEDAVACLASLSEVVPNLNLVVIGAGDRAGLLRQAGDQGVEERLHLLGSSDDVAACLEYLDIGILCSESEGFSNAIVEYKRAGLPVVCSEVGGNPEAVSDGEDGFVYPVGNAEALAEAVKALADDPDLRKRIGDLAKQNAEREFGMDRMLEAHQSLYRTVLARCTGRSERSKTTGESVG
jgi:L-malate glycosyltransferase